MAYDETLVIIPKKAALKDEIKGILRVMRDWRMTCLTPANFLGWYHLFFEAAGWYVVSKRLHLP
jgi:hypothetical protein